MIFGLCNDEIGYIIPPEDFLVDSDSPYVNHIDDGTGEDHYEETNSMGPDTASRIMEVFEALYRKAQG